MRRADIPPTPETLAHLLQTDPICRNSDLIELAKELASIESGYSIFLDSDWGSGKTFFVKQLQLLLKAMNPNLRDKCPDKDFQSILNDVHQLTEEDSSLRIFKESTNLSTFLPVYYNAWESDY